MLAELKKRTTDLVNGSFPGRFGEHRGIHGPKLDAAAAYLGLTEAQLRTELRSGKTLAEITKAHGKTAEGLVQALVDAAKKKLDAAVTAGRLTRAEADSMLAGLKQRITDFVNGRFPGRSASIAACAASTAAPARFRTAARRALNRSSPTS